MNKIEIREAKIEDLNLILKLNKKLFVKEYNEFDNSLNLDWTYSKRGKEYFSERIKYNNGKALVVEKGNIVIGYLCGGIQEQEENIEFYRKDGIYAELENMFIEEKFRNLGIGGKLIWVFIEWCKEKKVDHINVTASFQNKKALEFYRKYGFDNYDTKLDLKL